MRKFVPVALLGAICFGVTATAAYAQQSPSELNFAPTKMPALGTTPAQASPQAPTSTDAIILFETFEDATGNPAFPATFTRLNLDNAPLIPPYVGLFPSGTWEAQSLTAGGVPLWPSSAAYVSSNHATAGTAGNNWMITPQVSIPSTGAFLSWGARNFSGGAGAESYQVLVSTTTNAVASFTDTLFSIAAESVQPISREVSLDAYAGQNIFVAFQNNTPGTVTGNILIVDNILIGSPDTTVDLSVEEVYTLGQVPLTGVAPIVVSANVANNTLNDSIGNIQLILTISGVNSFTDTISVAPPAGLGSANYSFAPFTPVAPGSNTVTVRVLAPNDIDATNNARSFSQSVTNDRLSYSNNDPLNVSDLVTGTGGAMPTPALILTRYETTAPKRVDAVRMAIGNAGGGNNVIGKVIYAVVLDETGDVIATSDSLTVTQANVTEPITQFAINNPPTIEGEFYVGVAATQIVPGPYFFLQMENESPNRPNAYFRVNNLGGVTGTAPLIPQITDRYRIEAVVNDPSARLQVLHNAPQPGFDTVDVYVNGGLFIDDFVFRTGTAFADVPAGVELEIGIAPGNSTGPDDALFIFDGITLDDGESYIVVAAQDPDAAAEVTLLIFTPAREASGDDDQTDVLAHHGSPDAPDVKILETGINENAEIVPTFSYTDFAGYLELPTVNGYLLEVRTAGDDLVGTFSANLAEFDLGGDAITVLASGYAVPDSGEPAFGLFVALPSGGPFVALPANPARIQVIHNSPIAAAATVDIYVNGDLFVDDLAFRSATPFVDAPGGQELTIAVAPGTSTSAADAVFTTTATLGIGSTNIVVANSGAELTSFTLSVFAEGRENGRSGPDSTDILIHHGSSDAPDVQVFETNLNDPAAALTDVFAYTEFRGYLSVLETNGYVLQVRTADGDTVQSFVANLGTLGTGGQAITVLASGFADPANPGPDFGLFVATSFGGPLLELPTQVTSLRDNALARATRMYPNPAADRVNFSFQELGADRLIIEVVDAQGRVVQREDLRPTATSFDHELRLKATTGVYFIRLSTDQHVHTRRLMVR